ncbi:hypothetical protein [Chiayiivirga flava]|uniref:Uncharacterized protein n=1 Tax=Chiayiivirga flava TaxID=659595 RepID=A0A7W8D6P7_9GAMM|nr:hypothetical protein [Chiayiivirga flava]MBB5207795.1 hypothetical protein [Chiayiivirga flava]
MLDEVSRAPRASQRARDRGICRMRGGAAAHSARSLRHTLASLGSAIGDSGVLD